MFRTPYTLTTLTQYQCYLLERYYFIQNTSVSSYKNISQIDNKHFTKCNKHIKLNLADKTLNNLLDISFNISL